MPILHSLIITLVLSLSYLASSAQTAPKDSLLMPFEIKPVEFLSLENAPTFDKKRFWVSAGTGFGIYAGTSVALWQAWYKDYPLTGFHTFNDMREWRGMDKAGHLQAAFLQSNYTFKGAIWTGMERRKAMWIGVAVATGIQATIEIMDGFSEEWGFSVGDIGFNVLGASLFAAQETLWKEQRILMKVSSTQPDYPSSPIYSVDGTQVSSLSERATELYGSSPSEVFVKDYNAMTIWASFNIRSFTKNKGNGKFPAWLNLALGFGAENMYGGFENKWADGQGHEFAISGSHPRYQQFYLSPDIDLSRIPSRHRWVKFALGFFNWIKIPGPALEVNTKGKAYFHAFYW